MTPPPALTAARFGATREYSQEAAAKGRHCRPATLAAGAGVKGVPQERRDLSDIAGTWKADKAVDAALAAQDRVDLTA